MFCNKCGAKVSGEQKYCVKCGNEINNKAIDTIDYIMTAEELENLRKNTIKKEKPRFVIAFVGGVLFLIFIFTIFDNISIGNLLAASLFSLFFAFLISRGDQREFQKNYKRTIVLEALKSMFSDVHYEPNNGINEQILRDTAMISMGDRYYSNDYISAKYKDIPFIASDVLIEDERTDSDGDTYTVTLFKGQWFIFDFNKSFKADLQICEKDFKNNKRRSIFNENRLKKIELEDINFNKQFNIYAQNELDAFYILTPNTMEKIKEVENKVSGKLLFCFIDNKLHVGLYNSKDLFEYKDIYRPVNLEQEKNNVLQDMKNITEFVDILDLDNDLFRRNF